MAKLFQVISRGWNPPWVSGDRPFFELDHAIRLVEGGAFDPGEELAAVIAERKAASQPRGAASGEVSSPKKQAPKRKRSKK